MLIAGILLLVASSTYAHTRSSGVYCSSDDFQNFAYQVPKHACACNAKTAGTLRYHNNQIEFCNGKEYVGMGAGGGGSKIGSEDNPGKSCRDILSADGKAKSGLYYIKVGGEVTKTYCYMGEICGSKGWTMIMKIDGKKNTFHYNSKRWTDKHSYNEAAVAGGLDNQETKLNTYHSFKFNKLCLGLKTSGITNWLRLNYEANSLFSVISDGKYRPTHLGRSAWKKLIHGSSLQPHCNREGFNAYHVGARARIGIISNQENNCGSPDSRIGFGTGGNYCKQNDKNSAGNEARCGADLRDKSIFSFGYILAQEPLPGAELGSADNPAPSCRAIQAAKSASKNGEYYLRIGGQIVRTFCVMDNICGSSGWTMIMKVDGRKNTFHYNSAKWTDTQPYNEAAAAGGLDSQETKLNTYHSFKFNKLCLGLKTSGITKWLRLNYEANSLFSVISDGKYRPTHLGRNAWKSLVSGSSLQPHCNREGFNAYHVGARARIGIITNQENNCGSPDSRLGIGTGGNYCKQNDKHSAGNEARCGGDKGDRSTPSFGYILAQEPLPRAELGSWDNPAASCRAIKAARSASKSAAYYMRLKGKVVKPYCVMDNICGSSGWTMIMKVDGSKTTFSYDSAYWRNKAVYNVRGASGGLDNQETKLETYSDFPFKALCLGMKTGATLRWLKVPVTASSLYALIADNRYRATRLGRNAWKSLVPHPSLQPHCNREGFNAYHIGARARIGIITNQENNCGSPDSRLGIGTAGAYCGQNNNISAGNAARCGGDGGNKDTRSLAFIFAA